MAGRIDHDTLIRYAAILRAIEDGKVHTFAVEHADGEMTDIEGIARHLVDSDGDWFAPYWSDAMRLRITTTSGMETFVRLANLVEGIG